MIPTIKKSELPCCHTKTPEGGTIIICSNEKCTIKEQCGFYLRESRIGLEKGGILGCF